MRSDLLVLLCVQRSLCFWDDYTTTKATPPYEDPRQSFFLWRYVPNERAWGGFIPNQFAWDYHTRRARALSVIAGLSIEFLPITTAAVLNRRTLITSANALEPFTSRQEDVRIWACGRGGSYKTPYRYRVYRWRRLLPRSVNPEHQVGPRGRFTTRHDIAIVHSRDQMYLRPSNRYLYAKKVYITAQRDTFSSNHMFIAGTRTIHNIDISQGYNIDYYDLGLEYITNCEQYLPKFWGKHICFHQKQDKAMTMMGLLNGASLIVNDKLMGIGAFELRYNERRVLVFTDLRYYVFWINTMSNITPGEYYDYSYQEWGATLGWTELSDKQKYFYPTQYVKHDLWPLGK